MESCLMGTEFKFCQMKRILVMGHTTMRMYSTLPNFTLKKNGYDDKLYVMCTYSKKVFLNKMLKYGCIYFVVTIYLFII